jgi:signal transduction histidine kinase
MVSHPRPIGTEQRVHTVLLLRWVLIVATSYLILFSGPLSRRPFGAALFIALYFGSNIVAGALLPRMSNQRACEEALVLFDLVMVSIGLALTPTASSQFFVVYFVVVFLSALSERLGLVVGAALLVSATHLYTTSQFVGWGKLLADGYALRVPFLFVVALFFGYLVAEARRRERDAEEARKRQLRAEFSSALMHDLRNSLGVIESLALMLLDGEAGPLNREQADFTRRIHASARHLITFALNLIDAARIEAGELFMQPRPTSLADVVEGALLLARSASDLKGVTLRCAVEPGLPPLSVDATQLERVVSNLLGNAIKFTPAGGSVGLSVQRQGDELVLDVCDDGVGIPAAALPTIFDKRGQPRGNGPQQGSGLGLSIVKAIVQAHGGRVRITSTPGNGTTVSVHLPMQPAAPSDRNGRAPELLQQGPPGSVGGGRQVEEAGGLLRCQWKSCEGGTGGSSSGATRMR